ncbi:hypothetical protein NDI54_20840 [Haloarcula sp. S1AR25-5A]|uniref:Domain of unknown function domain-containing protein n=1 Tax=Haloarcula terrestris TaxID=2950533 RepID=A0AAE4F0V2_9EURY|nr:hypothetical protein [Haloarcula terrestris]MDS0223778.1 hypothetical protein [Haloarcula terrestris]
MVNGLKDFLLLGQLLEPAEREKVFEELGPEETDDVLSAMLAFAYLGLNGDQPRLKACIERGILQGENVDKLFQSSGRATNLDVSISVEHNPDIEKLHQRLENGRELTDAEIGALVRAGKIGREDIEELAESPRGFPGVFAGQKCEFSEQTGLSANGGRRVDIGDTPTNSLGTSGQLLVGKDSQ